MVRISCEGALGVVLVLGLVGACTKSSTGPDASAEDALVSEPEDAEIAQAPDREDPAPAPRGPWAVVLVAANDVLNVRAEADASSAIVGRLEPTARNVTGTGRAQVVGSATWREVRVDAQTGWVNAAFLTEQVDPSRFAADPRIPEMLDGLQRSIEGSGDPSALLSPRGLYLAVFDPVAWLPPAKTKVLWSSEIASDYNGPACEKCVHGTARKVVGERFLDAYVDPDRELSFNRWKAGGNASVRLPAKLAGFPFVTVYDPGDAPDVPDWLGVTVFFEYLEGHPSIVGLVLNAWSP